MKNKIVLGLFFLLAFNLHGQRVYWQQHVDYKMDIDFDVTKHQYKGQQRLLYTNNSPDVLNKVFYHLYFNAFQPNSMMDVRSQTIKDADPRVGSRIGALKESEIGYQKILSIKQNGIPLKYHVEGTILEVELVEPLNPGANSLFEMEFEAQVPVQIRRSGRDNSEGIDYSMSQWYPKMCEYDEQGWHANPYVGREFYGIWGDFDVNIRINRDYIIGATGNLANANEVGYGYNGTAMRPANKSKVLNWHFVAKNVHDFVWAADRDYTHVEFQQSKNLTLHFFYQKTKENQEAWGKLPKTMAEVFDFVQKKYGEYGYEHYSFIQGGDGGMEYPMATLITGNRAYRSLVGVSVHELMHSWYQMALATNESLYSWMDEGFTSYASAAVMNHLKKVGFVQGQVEDDPHLGSYGAYAGFFKSGMAEPLSTHSDHFETNSAFGVASYVTGAVFLHQLSYIIGKEDFDKGMLEYFNQWAYKHPNANDFIRVMEGVSNLELDWYREYWINTTHTIDYGVKSVEKEGRATHVTLEKIGVMPMPLDVEVTYKNGKKEIFNIALRIMRGNKKQEQQDAKYSIAKDWPWTHPEYELIIPASLKKIKTIEIDPAHKMADMDRSNNVFEQ